MSYLQRRATHEEREIIAVEIERLFILNDKRLDAQKKIVLVDEVSRIPQPIDIIVRGIRKMHDVELKYIRFTDIKAAILSEVQPYAQKVEKAKCDNCEGSGHVCLVDEEKRSYSFACICPIGARKAEVQGMERWNGEARQSFRVKGKEKKMIHYDVYLLGEKKFIAQQQERGRRYPHA